MLIHLTMTHPERLGNAFPVLLAPDRRDVQEAGGVVAAKDDGIKVRLHEVPSEMSAEFRVSRGDVDGGSRESPLLNRVVRTPIDTLDLEEIGLDIEVGPDQIKELLEQRAKTVTRVFDTIDFIAGDLTKFKPLVPASLPSAISGRILNSDGTPAASVRVRVLEPSTPATANGTGFDLALPWPNPETVTDARGAFRIALPPRLLPDDGVVLSVQGGNKVVEHPLRRIDLIAGDGSLGVVPLDSILAPLPTSVLAKLQAVVRPTSEDDVLDNPEQFTEPAPVITLGDGDCAVNFRSNSGVIDKFGYSMLVRLVEPELSGRRLGTRVGAREKYLLSASSAGLTKYISTGDLIAAMSQLGKWELVGRVPIEAPIDVTAYLEAVQRNPRIVPKAATLGMGYIVKMHQIWVPNGMSLGDLVYSLPLAPGEQQRIAVSDERETLSVREQEALSAEEFQNYRENADSSTNAVFNSAFNESAAGGSKMKTSSEAGSFGGGLGAQRHDRAGQAALEHADHAGVRDLLLHRVEAERAQVRRRRSPRCAPRGCRARGSGGSRGARRRRCGSTVSAAAAMAASKGKGVSGAFMEGIHTRG